MALTVEGLEGHVRTVITARSLDEMSAFLEPILAVLASPELLGRSFLHGMGSNSSRDYPGVLEALAHLCSKEHNPWAVEASERIRAISLTVLVERPVPAEAPDLSGDSASAEDQVSCDLSVSVHKPSGSAPLSPASGNCAVFATSMLLVALLPLMADALPRDANGICVIPHRHKMEQQAAGEDSMYFNSSGRLAFRTNKVCDNCQTRIMDRHFYHCAENCDIDFCENCHHKLQEVFDAFFERSGENKDEDRERRHDRLTWVITVMDRVAYQILHLSPDDRKHLANEFAFEWPTNMFERFIRVVIDVVNAKVVHVQDVKDIQSDEKFWYAMGLLQFLYSANALPCNTMRLDEQNARGPKIEYDHFILEGINKCEPISEWQRWRDHPSAKVPEVLDMDEFGLTADFCSFLTHNNLVPVSFRRVCLLCDIWEQIQLEMGRVIPLHVKVRRTPCLLLEDVLKSFEGRSDSELRRPLRVTFEDEEGAGPGVTKEFFQVALRSFLDGSTEQRLFRYNEHERTYWFNEEVDQRDAFRACGILLGQAVLNNVLVPNIFPKVLYELLLRTLESPCARPVGLEDLAAVSKETAQSLQLVLDYGADDIDTVFGDLATNHLPAGCPLSQDTKAAFVQAYVEWYLSGRIEAQLTPLSEGFRAILGGSVLLRTMVDAVQLEKIVCGGSVAVDVAAIRRGAACEGWSRAEEADYLGAFWRIIEDFSESERMQFVVFVTASDRVPLRGWQDLQLTVQKNGVGDDRLPTAHTCFSQLLLPKYSSTEKLRQNLLLAVANSEGFGLR
mmetsp:Transcript_19741/g.43146  ORF Transcript_19741/g.43146 Transcript_19741/m.43146 type:complete len:788 (+) Transcript_19741:88-2451(+)